MVRFKKRKRLEVPSTGMNLMVMADHSEMLGIKLSHNEIIEKFNEASIGSLLPAISRLIAAFHMDDSNAVL